jgi:hypothetical protein
VTGDRLRQAADIVANDARARAAEWSRSIPPSMRTDVAGKVATITASAPVARPAELRLRHPLFGNRRFWYAPPGRPFLAPAAEAKADAAAVQYSQVIDDWAHKDGFH